MARLLMANKLRWTRFAAHIACALPFVYVMWAWTAAPSLLGFNPVEATIRHFGDWALRILLLCLVMTPLGQLTRSPLPIAIRRLTGLWSFAYVLLHMFSWVAADLGFDWAAIWADIVKRSYITVGMAAFLLLMPLAITSTNGMIKRLGAARWKRLHRLVYPAMLLAPLHFFMMRKGVQIEPLIYATIACGLLATRIPAWRKR